VLRAELSADVRVRCLRARGVMEGVMWCDRWFKVGLLGAFLACVACATPIAALLLGAIGLAAWAGHIDLVLFPVLGAFVVLAAHRYWVARRRTEE